MFLADFHTKLVGLCIMFPRYRFLIAKGECGALALCDLQLKTTSAILHTVANRDASSTNQKTLIATQV